MIRKAQNSKSWEYRFMQRKGWYKSRTNLFSLGCSKLGKRNPCLHEFHHTALKNHHIALDSVSNAPLTGWILNDYFDRIRNNMKEKYVGIILQRITELLRPNSTLLHVQNVPYQSWICCQGAFHGPYKNSHEEKSGPITLVSHENRVRCSLFFLPTSSVIKKKNFEKNSEKF